MTAVLSTLDERLDKRVRDSRDELVATVEGLVACVTLARVPGDPAGDEEKLQRILAKRLEAIGAEVDLWEPEAVPADHPLFPGGIEFKGRPQLVARIPGTGGGRSMLVNGHIDVVSAEAEQWSHDPFKVWQQDGLLYGRGVLDMKGGIATLLTAVEALNRTGIKLKGDVLFATNTDEESTGAGSWAITQRGYRADAGVCAEPSSFNAWRACRGMVKPRITVHGRPGHTQFRQPHWKDGGPVNAIEKMQPVLDGIKLLRDEWSVRSDCQHPLLASGDIVPATIGGGTWVVTYPSSCTLACDVQYLPGQGDADGSGRSIKAEVMDRLNAAVSCDPWFDDHPLEWAWGWGAAPAEVSGDHPLIDVLLECGALLGHPGGISGTDSWHDAANFTVHGGTPSFSYGPGDELRTHTVDEYISVDDMVDYATTIALVMMRYCGVHDGV